MDSTTSKVNAYELMLVALPLISFKWIAPHSLMISFLSISVNLHILQHIYTIEVVKFDQIQPK